MHKHTFMFILFILAQDKRTNTDDLVYEQPCLFIWLKQIKSSISGSCFEPPGFRIKQFYYDVTFLLWIITKRRKSPGNVMHTVTTWLDLQPICSCNNYWTFFSKPSVFLSPFFFTLLLLKLHIRLQVKWVLCNHFNHQDRRGEFGERHACLDGGDRRCALIILNDI